MMVTINVVTIIIAWDDDDVSNDTRLLQLTKAMIARVIMVTQYSIIKTRNVQ